MHTNAMQQEELWGEAGSSQCFSFGTFFFGPTQTEQTIVTMLVYDLRDTYRCLTTCSDPCSFLFQYIPAWKGQKDTGHKSRGSGCRTVFCPQLDLEKLPRTHLVDSPKTLSNRRLLLFPNIVKIYLLHAAFWHPWTAMLVTIAASMVFI